jgi:hypothetical protein
MRKGSLAVLLCTLAIAAPVEAAPDPAQELVFVGLRPLTSANGAGDITKLAEAQQIRKVAEAALSQTAKQPVIGHDDLVRQAGKGYLVRWFKCEGSVGCVAAVLAPTTALGYRTGVTGEYYNDGTTYHFRMVTFSINEGKVGKEVDFDLPAADVQNEDQWRAKLAPFTFTVGGHIKLTTNVGDTKCKIDGADCQFDADGQTISVPAGDHTLELSKEGYQNEKVIVSVKTGATEEVAIALKPGTKSVAVGPVGRMKPTLTAIRTDKRPEIDGKLDDAVWQKAWIETNFTQNFPDENTAPTERTEVRVLYDDEAVYVGIRCFDQHPNEIIARLTRRDRDIESDKVTVDISSKHDHASAYHFEVNAAGRQLDGTRSNDTDFSTDWDGLWYSAVTRDNLGWTAELAIPLGALRYEGDTTAFGFQVRRYVQRRSEVDEWSYIPRTAQGEVSYYGELEGLTGLNAKRLLQIVPYDSRSLTLRRNQPPLDGNTTGGNFGADLKLGLTPALTLDATINPDFGTVEVDQVVLNLSTVETYFPEKRPFFLEGADIYSTPFQLFYSRRVGATPPDPNFQTATAQVTQPQPTGQILGAVKTTGLVAGRLTLGLMDALTASENVTIQRSPLSPPNEQWLVAPLSNYAVLRLRQEFGTNSSIGILATAVNRMEDVNAAAPEPGDACPIPHGGLHDVGPPNTGHCFSDAYSGGIDTRLRTGDGTWGASGQVVGAVLEKGPTRLVPDGTVIKPGDPGYGVHAEAGKYGGNWLFKALYEDATPNLELNDAGFQGTVNYHRFFAQLVRRSTKPSGDLRDRSIALNASYITSWNFQDPNETWMYLTSSVQFSNFWQVNMFLGPYYRPYVQTRDVGTGVRNEKFGGFGAYYAEIDMKTDPRKSVIFSIMEQSQRMLRGAFVGNQATLSLRSLSALELDLIASANITFGDPRYIDKQTDMMTGANTYYFGDLDARSYQATLRGTYTFTPTLSLQAYTQLFAASAVYTNHITAATAVGTTPYLPISAFHDTTLFAGANNRNFRESTLNVNVFLRWEFTPGSALWFVYTRASDAYDTLNPGDPLVKLGELSTAPTTDVFLVKLSYMWEPLRTK